MRIADYGMRNDKLKAQSNQIESIHKLWFSQKCHSGLNPGSGIFDLDMNSELPTIPPKRDSLDDVLSQLALDSIPRRSLFWGDGMGGIASYVAGWMAEKDIDVILLDGANHFDPYMVSSFARKVWIPPESLLRKIRIARAFTCYQMATLMGERLVSLLRQEGIATLPKKPWVIVLGPVTTFFDEDVPEREVRPLFERSLKRVEEMATAGIPFFFFQPSTSAFRQTGSQKGMRRLTNSRREYLLRRLFQFSHRVWRIGLEDEGPKLILEKGLTEKSLSHSKEKASALIPL